MAFSKFGSPKVQCGGKIAFASSLAAKRAAENMNRRNKRLGRKVTSYRCDWCKKYHVGGYN